MTVLGHLGLGSSLVQILAGLEESMQGSLVSGVTKGVPIGG